MTGEELRALRHRLGLTQRAFAEQLGVEANSLARLERDERTIGQTLAILARLLAQRAPKRRRR
jgi:transcriptional regulator with XRE-family HTH domain